MNKTEDEEADEVQMSDEEVLSLAEGKQVLLSKFLYWDPGICSKKKVNSG